MTLVLVQGESVNLYATSKDEDTLSDGTTTETREDDAAVIWTASGGGIIMLPARTDSGKPWKFTAPMVPAGMESIAVGVMAQADDDSTAPPGGPLEGHPGNRDDQPGASVTIAVRIVKSGPTTVKIVRQKALTQFTEFWANNYPDRKTAGCLASQLEVSGGTPPDPPKNWNGLFVREDIRRHPTDPGNATDADFDFDIKADQFASASHEGFVVGSAGSAGSRFAPFIGPTPAADNCFWDFFAVLATEPVLKEGSPDKTVRGLQTYSCKTGELTPKFVLTTTFHNANFLIVTARVTEVNHTHAPE
jgi:hypothetical protein